MNRTPIIFFLLTFAYSWFQPVIGYMMPVFVVNVLTFIGIWAWFRCQDKESFKHSLIKTGTEE